MEMFRRAETRVIPGARGVEAPRLPHTTVFGKHCECIAQKCTLLERLPPLASHLLLLSHCVLTQHGGKNSICCVETYATSGIRTMFCLDQTPGVGHLRYANNRIQWVVLCGLSQCRLISTSNYNFADERKNSVNAKNNELMLFKLYVQV